MSYASQNNRTFFVTSVTNGRRALLQSDRSARLFMNVLEHYRDKGCFLLHEFVVMPNHFHLMLTPADGILLQKAMQFIKGGFWFRAKQEFGAKFSIWQASFTDHRIHDEDDYDRHRKYIHENPVRAGLVKSAAEFVYSSVSAGIRLDAAPQWLKPRR